MGKSKKFRCWACGGLKVIKWGKQRGKQRFRCKDCGILFTRSNRRVSQKNREVWFREWIVGKAHYKNYVKWYLFFKSNEK